jgi:hypothetical protein
MNVVLFLFYSVLSRHRAQTGIAIHFVGHIDKIIIYHIVTFFGSLDQYVSVTVTLVKTITNYNSSIL